MNTPSLKSLNSSIAAGFGTFAVAVAAAVAPVSDANAEIITTFANTSITVPANVDGVYLNLRTGANGTAGASVTGWDINPYLTSGVFTLFWPSTAAASGGGVAVDNVYTSLTPGSVISSSSIFSQASGGGGPGSTINFQSAGTHILGFRFLNEATSATNYGYMTIQNGANAGFPATITGWVYENTGAAITVVPEPGTYAMLLAGLAVVGGIAARRRTASAA